MKMDLKDKLVKICGSLPAKSPPHHLHQHERCEDKELGAEQLRLREEVGAQQRMRHHRWSGAPIMPPVRDAKGKWVVPREAFDLRREIEFFGTREEIAAATWAFNKELEVTAK
jgi:hypothetical protein